MESKVISPDFPFNSNYVEIKGSRIHYIDEGSGDPILFLHGNPTSSYLWRNIIPYLTSCGRCIAPDLIGMGQSDRPDIGYRFVDHAQYVQGFIEKLGLEKITLVVHDWGSALGFHYAVQHEENIKGLAFMEAFVRPARWANFPPDYKLGFKLMRTPVIGWFMISVLNIFVRQILPQATVREMSEKERGCYSAPYKTIGSRKPVRQWPCEIPIDGKPEQMHKLVSNYSQWLQETGLPKLLLAAQPGAIITVRTVAWCRAKMKNLTVVDIGKGLHYVQEDNPHGIVKNLVKWYKGL